MTTTVQTDTPVTSRPARAIPDVEASLEYRLRTEDVQLWFLYRSENIAPEATNAEIGAFVVAITDHLQQAFQSPLGADTLEPYKLEVLWCKQYTGIDETVCEWCVAVMLPYRVAQHDLLRANADRSIHAVLADALAKAQINWLKGVVGLDPNQLDRLGAMWPPQRSRF